MNHDLYCDWFGIRPVATKEIPAVVKTVKDTQSECYKKGLRQWVSGTTSENGMDSCGPDYFKATRESCLKWNTQLVCDGWYPVTPTVTQESKLECQSNDDFCTPGCELEDMQCIDEENDDNRNGVKDSEENNNNDRESNNNNEDIVYCEGQRVPEGEDSCYDQYDFEEGDGTGCDRNDEYCNEEDECGRPDIDCIDDTKERDDE